ncbi:MAG TPA: ATPase, partial [bacterium]|nr:ATPase [bacterium]
MNIDIQAIQAKIERESAFVEKITAEVGKVIVGQNY